MAENVKHKTTCHASLTSWVQPLDPWWKERTKSWKWVVLWPPHTCQGQMHLCTHTHIHMHICIHTRQGLDLSENRILRWEESSRLDSLLGSAERLGVPCGVNLVSSCNNKSPKPRHCCVWWRPCLEMQRQGGGGKFGLALCLWIYIRVPCELASLPLSFLSLHLTVRKFKSVFTPY